MNENIDIETFPTNLNGTIKIPPSKSLSHRALICAALSDGETTVSNIVFSEDVKATINALKLIGAHFDEYEDAVRVKGVRKLKLSNKEVFCNESGSTLRFLIPIFSLTKKEITFTGKKSLISRPQKIYEDIFEEDKNIFSVSEDKIVVKGSIKARTYYLDGTVSSQFFTGLMMALPLLEEDSYIHIKGTLESKSYIDLTIDVLEHFGINVQKIENGYYIQGSQSYKAKDYRVEGDFSQAAFFLVGGILSGNTNLDDLSGDSSQGDKQIINIIKDMKGRIIFTENGFTAIKSETFGTTIDLSNCPDLGPIVALLASLSEGTTIIENAGRLRIKESDRIESTVNTLTKLGADISATEDQITINGKQSLIGGVSVDSYNDHRIAMMLAIASTRCEKPITITNANAVTKSYPHFFEDFELVGGILK